MEVVKDALATWNYLNGRSGDTPPKCPKEVKLVIELTRAAASIATTEEYRQSVKAVSEAYTKSVEPPPVQPFMVSTKSHEEIRDEMMQSRLRDTAEGIKRLEEFALAAEGPICPLTLIGEYPRACIGDKCMWNGKSANECVAHVLVRGGNITTEAKGANS